MEHSWTQRIFDHLALPDESLPGQTLIELVGNKRILIEHHKGVLAYSREQVMIQTQDGPLAIYGCNLRLCRMLRPQLIICGHITRVQFEGTGRA